jgi:serine/threonine protein kinase
MSLPQSDPQMNMSSSPPDNSRKPDSMDFLAGLTMELESNTPTMTSPSPAPAAPSSAPSTLTGSISGTATVTNVPAMSKTRLPKIPGFEIEGEIGRGAMGVVYKARHTSLKRTVAIKMVLDCALNNPKVLQRFYDEAEAVGRLQHQGIVQIYNSGEFDGVPFFCLEYVDGQSLETHKGKQWDFREAAQLIIQLCEAIHYAHTRGIVHRDMKPANVLLTSAGKPKITDFGLAKFVSDDKGRTASGAIMGTPSYMSPEQASPKKEDPIGPAADVYALGAMLYELIAGQPPFQADSALDTIMQVLTSDPRPLRDIRPDTPKELQAIVHRCLRKASADRYPSAETLAADLRRYLNGEQVRAKGPSTLGRFSHKFGKKQGGRSMAVYLILFLFLAAIAGLGYWYWVAFANK